MNRVRAAAVAALAALAMVGTPAAAWATPAAAGPLDVNVGTAREESGARSLTVATVDAGLSRDGEGSLAADLASGTDAQALQLTAAVQAERPDVLVITGVDVDASGDVLASLRDDYFASDRGGESGVRYEYSYAAQTNVGQPSGTDLDGDGVVGGAGDAYGDGDFAGQRSLLVLSTQQIDTANVRTFNSMLWKELPGNRLSGSGLGSVAAESTPLQSTSVWDLPIRVGDQTVHVVATSTASGSSTADTLRREDQLRFLRGYVAGSESLAAVADDKGREGALPVGSRAVVAGSLGSEAASTAKGQLLDGAVLSDPSTAALAGLGSTWWGTAMARLQADSAATRVDGDGAGTRSDYVAPTPSLPVSSSGSAVATVHDGETHRLVWLTVSL
ncbi:MAG: hypothetical protein LBE25_00330 [Arthrobacter sp.]|jgi:hypothetical protein|nr:hypothetical protein [Arthrobacter sp.]